MSEGILKSPLPKIGMILRVYRERTNRSQSEIAKASHISTSMLSQIERGVVSPSLETLLQVCRVLGLEAGELFSRLEEKSPVRIHRSGERLRNRSQGALYEQLVVSADKSYPAEMFLLEVQPRSERGLSGVGHEGVEMGYVLEGQAVITVSHTEYSLYPGDSISFSSYLPHHLKNTGENVFRAVWSVVPPHKDFLAHSEQHQ